MQKSCDVYVRPPRGTWAHFTHRPRSCLESPGRDRVCDAYGKQYQDNRCSPWLTAYETAIDGDANELQMGRWSRRHSGPDAPALKVSRHARIMRRVREGGSLT